MDIDILGSIVVSIPACHAGDRGSIPRRGGRYFFVVFNTAKKAFSLLFLLFFPNAFILFCNQQNNLTFLH